VFKSCSFSVPIKQVILAVPNKNASDTDSRKWIFVIFRVSIQLNLYLMHTNGSVVGYSVDRVARDEKFYF